MWSVVLGGTGTILVVLAVMRHWPELLRLGPLHLIGTETKSEPEALAPNKTDRPKQFRPGGGQGAGGK